MHRRRFITTVSAGLLTVAFTVEAQHGGNRYKVGYLSPDSEHNPVDTAFEQAMRELGYADGQNISMERRYAGARADRLAAFASELVALNPDVVAVWSTAGALAVKRATGTIPVVFLSALDPIGLDIVMGVPIRLWSTPGAAATPPPLLGQHTDEILTRLLRIPKAKVGRLRAAGVVWERNDGVLLVAA